MGKADAPEGASRERVNALITACWTTQVIAEAVRLGLPERLSAGAADSAALAAATGSNADALNRLLCALASIGLVHHHGGSMFSLAADGRHLLADAPDSLRGVALHWGDRQWRSFGLLGAAVADGKPHVAEGFENLQKDPLQADVFNRAMAEQSLRIGRAAAAAYDFSACHHVLDVGGGYGAVLAALLEAHPHLDGASFDLPEVESGATRYLGEHALGGRARYIGGSFFDAVPTGFDCLVLKFIIHDWGDDESRRILANCARSLEPGGVLLLLEQVVPELITPDPTTAAVLRGDLIMLNIGGRERTRARYASLLAEAGLRLTRIVPTGTTFSVIEARPAAG
jgi:SAM-dependent methyltransferase